MSAVEHLPLEQAIHEAHATGPIGKGALLHAAGRDALNRYLMGGRIVFQVDRASDIREVVAFAERNGIKPVILGGDEAWLVAKELAKANVPVILNPLNDLPADFDRLGSTLENAARLHRAGVRIAFSSGDTPQARLVRQLAGNAVAHGLPWEAALAAITSTPADIFGLGATHGRVALGPRPGFSLLSAGSCPLAADRLAARLKVAGFPDSDLHPFAAPDHPKEGGLVAISPGRDLKLNAILLLAHSEVVEAKREDWTRDPFKLVEENGSFYARGASDDKAEAAIWVDTLIRYRSENYRPRRTLKVALTCGEETAGAFNGADWLTQNRRDLIDAAFALNEGAAGELDTGGRRGSPGVGAAGGSCQDSHPRAANPRSDSTP